MPSAADIAFVFLFAVVATAFETFVFFPRFRAAVAAGKPDARRNAYRRVMLLQWTAAAAALALWAWQGRAWRALGVVPQGGWRLALGAALAAALVALSVRQARTVRRLSAEQAEALRPRLAGVEFILPHTRTELRWFTAVSVTAGVCEELLYRGFLFWILSAYLGTAGALVAQAVLFAVGHSYQGPVGALKAGAVALVLGLVVLGTGWLLPAMVIHALIDASAGVVGYGVLGEENGGSAPPAAASAA